ncbi:hypothetical protein COT70_01215 [candidate division WWE3 bacterium CG09_land_8_20_14_0_10_47_33]|uniref:LysM domain-containing protein n=1 Tax=candidate division WWE3 bacterium CG_4_9_14_0_2_um_filter_48_10 TaxID=1975078 RepID=A0A2M8EI25_UNCKA|nr:MAG: hypothetical protein COT70_01215 [candidate division WWE3 bacterium CG09_land_8_20_14_0_10_47_33]PJC21947.1 MAG: hypothetical protein CO059_02950 [candidate division WWE3 bacterium CG_4_9_14_0_2_um_filter_48_10]PJE52322.1 MAG: hypothetical protein COV28_00285 [candidate division WWE3 bacterium CG10_big_fil_rev_8_21_14_0_10_48_23]
MLMDRREEKPPLSILRGQLKLGLKGEVKKETLPEEIFAFVKSFLFYCQRRVLGVSYFFWHTFASGFGLTAQLKLYVQGKLYRRKGQLAFPLAHASLLGISFSLLIFTSGLGEFLYQQTGNFSLGEGAAIIVDQPSVATEESKLLTTEVQTYIVQEGDTLYDIARRFHLTLDALAYTNSIGDPFNYQLQPRQKLTIPPVEGVIYRVKEGDTLELIAQRYQTELMDIVEFNYLFPPYKLTAGQELIVPYAQIPGVFLGSVSTPTGACGSLDLDWPTANQDVVGNYGCYISRYHGGYVCHLAIDLGADYETLYAVADGTVVAAGGPPPGPSPDGQCLSFGPSCNYGYGGYVFIDIGGGYQVRYAHISKPLVGVGKQVKAGQPVAVSGASGYAFGPHLHFELLCNGKRINPLPYLR